MRFLLELYLPRGGPPPAALAARGSAPGARCVGSIYLPEDETCFLVYEAHGAALVATAAQQAGIAYERVLPAVEQRAPRA